MLAYDALSNDVRASGAKGGAVSAANDWRPMPLDWDALHPWYRAVRDYLASLAPAGKIASRNDLDPCWFRSTLRFVNLVDVIHSAEGPRFRFRLVGTRQTELARREITGLFIEDAVLPDYVERIAANMRAVMRTKAPVYDRFPMPHPEREFIDSERVYFPLASDGENVDMILVACNYLGSDLGLPRNGLVVWGQSSSSAGMR